MDSAFVAFCEFAPNKYTGRGRKGYIIITFDDDDDDDDDDDADDDVFSMTVMKDLKKRAQYAVKYGTPSVAP